MKSEKVYLFHIRDAIVTILTYTKGLSENDFYENNLIKDAVIRNFEIIGEASKRISKQTRLEYPQVPWAQMAGMRDKLIHDYIQVDLQRVWDVVDKILPDLKRDIEFVISKHTEL